MGIEEKLEKLYAFVIYCPNIRTHNLHNMGFTGSEITELINSEIIVYKDDGVFGFNKWILLYEYGKKQLKLKNYEMYYTCLKICYQNGVCTNRLLDALLLHSITEENYIDAYKYASDMYFKNIDITEWQQDNSLVLLLLSSLSEPPENLKLIIDNIKKDKRSILRDNNDNAILNNDIRILCFEGDFLSAYLETKKEKSHIVKTVIYNSLLYKITRKETLELEINMHLKRYDKIVDYYNKKTKLMPNEAALLLLLKDLLMIENGTYISKNDFGFSANLKEAIEDKNYKLALKMVDGNTDNKKNKHYDFIKILLEEIIEFVDALEENKSLQNVQNENVCYIEDSIQVEESMQSKIEDNSEYHKLVDEDDELINKISEELNESHGMRLLDNMSKERGKKIISMTKSIPNISAFMVGENSSHLVIKYTLFNDGSVALRKLLNEAKCFIRNKKFKDALIVLKEAFDYMSCPEGWILTTIGKCHCHLGEIEEAYNYINIANLYLKGKNTDYNYDDWVADLENKIKQSHGPNNVIKNLKENNSEDMITSNNITHPIKNKNKSKEYLEDEYYIKTLAEKLYQTKDLLLLEGIDRERRNRIIAIVKSIPNINIFHIGNNKMVLKYTIFNDGEVDLKEVMIKAKYSFRYKNYEDCINLLNLAKVYITKPDEWFFAMLGMSYMITNKVNIGINYLIIATDLSYYNGTNNFDYSKYIKEHLKDEKPNFVMTEEEFYQEEETDYKIPYLPQILEEILLNRESIDVVVKKYELDDNQACILKLMIARYYYSINNEEFADQIFKKAIRTKNKSNIAKQLIEEINANKRFYKNRSNQDIVGMILARRLDSNNE